MAYYVFSNLEAGRAAGPLMVRAGVSSGQRRADHRLDRRGAAAPCCARGFTAAEIDDAEAVPHRLAAPAARDQRRHRRLPALGRAARAGHRPRSPAAGADSARVTYDDVARVAARLLDPARAVVAVAGPVADDAGMSAPPLRAVFFDVDFTLHPPRTRASTGAGYAEVCAAHGVAVDAARFEAAVTRALPLLDDHDDPVYDHGLFIRYTAAIIEHMGGQGEAVTAAATEIYDAWASNHHFDLYDDVHDVLPAARRPRPAARRDLELAPVARGLHRALRPRSLRPHAHLGAPEPAHEAPRQHLRGGARRRRRAGRRGADGRRQPEGRRRRARWRAGLRAVWLRRAGDLPVDPPADVPIIRRLDELPAIIWPATG